MHPIRASSTAMPSKHNEMNDGIRSTQYLSMSLLCKLMSNGIASRGIVFKFLKSSVLSLKGDGDDLYTFASFSQCDINIIQTGNTSLQGKKRQMDFPMQYDKGTQFQ